MTAGQDDELDIRLLHPDEIAESEGSQKARARAARYGEVESSSYTSFEERPVLWAFTVRPAEGPLLVLGGGEGVAGDVLLRVREDEAFSGMLYGKALVSSSSEPLEPHTVVRVLELPAQASWSVDSFYVSRERLSGMRDGDVLAVALHATEAFTSADTVEALVRARTADLVSVDDPLAVHATYRPFLTIVRALRRLRRLRELDGPSIIIDNDLRLARETFAEVAGEPLPPWPADVVPLAEELGLISL